MKLDLNNECITVNESKYKINWPLKSKISLVCSDNIYIVSKPVLGRKRIWDSGPEHSLDIYIEHPIKITMEWKI